MKARTVMVAKRKSKSAGELTPAHLLQLREEIISKTTRIGDAAQCERFANRATWIASTPVTRRLRHEFDDEWFAAVADPLRAIIRLLVEKNMPPRLQAFRETCLKELNNLESIVSNHSPEKSHRRGRPSKPQPPRGAAGIVWRLAFAWKSVFAKDPSASGGSVFVKTCRLVLDAVDLCATDDLCRHSTRNWRRHGAQKQSGELPNEDELMRVQIDRLRSATKLG
jgi:hypothetical protein